MWIVDLVKLSFYIHLQKKSASHLQLQNRNLDRNPHSSWESESQYSAHQNFSHNSRHFWILVYIVFNFPYIHSLISCNKIFTFKPSSPKFLTIQSWPIFFFERMIMILFQCSRWYFSMKPSWKFRFINCLTRYILINNILQ